MQIHPKQQKIIGESYGKGMLTIISLHCEAYIRVWRRQQGTSQDAWCGKSLQAQVWEDWCGQQAEWVSSNTLYA